MKLTTAVILLTCFVLARQSHFGLVEFEKRMAFLTEQLGYNTLREMYTNISAKTAPIEGDALLEKLSTAVENKFNSTKEALLKLRGAIEAYYRSPQKKSKRSSLNNTNFQNCCTVVDNLNNLEGRPQNIMHAGCKFTPNYKDHEELDYAEDVSKIMKENLEKNKDLKWQYFTSANGTMFLYPARRLDRCTSFDPRNRSWFVETATVHPKDVVIVLDVSGSMELTNVKGKSLLQIVKAGANMVVNTLNSNDKIGIVAFSDDVKIPEKYDCFQHQLAMATPQNKMAINSFINRLRGKGLTNYVSGLRKAFEYFKNLNSTSNDRDRILLFLSDGMPTVGGDREKILNLIREEASYFDNSIIIMTFGIGKALQDPNNQQLLIDMANYTNEPNPNGHPVGRFTKVTCSNAMRRSMADYYIGLHTYRERKEPIFTLPYYDAGRLGYVMSQCLPVQADGEFIGVTCIDIRLNDLLDDIINFQHGELSYAFIINNNGLAVFHPLLPIPSSVNEDVGLIDIKSLERDTAVRQVIESMMEYKEGRKELTTQRTLSRGNGIQDGIGIMWVKSTYMWKSIQGSNFSVCIVFNSEEHRSILPDRPVESFLYHNFRSQNFSTNRTCKIHKRILTKKISVVKFAPSIFLNSLEYKNGNETDSNITDIVKYMNGQLNTSSLIQEGIRATVAFTEPIEKFWKESDAKSNDTIPFVWRYIATLNGVLRIYPGVFLNKLYDARHRPWFKRTLSHKGKIVLSRPYSDYWGAGNIISISGSICAPNCNSFNSENSALAVIAADVRIEYLHDLLISSIPQCQKQNRCLIIDSSGYIVLHDDFIFSNSQENEQHYDAVHLAAKEPDITKTLLEGNLQLKSCIDIMNMENKYFWELVNIESPQEFPGFVIYPVKDMNVFIIIKNDRHSSTSSYSCKKVEELIKEDVHQESISCREIKTGDELTDCSCSSNTVFNYCENTFDLNKLSDLWPMCMPDMPQPDMTNQEEEREESDPEFQPCFPNRCAQSKNRSDCLTKVECTWCEFHKIEEDPPEPFCTEDRKCEFLKREKDSSETNEMGEGGVEEKTIIVVVCVILVIIIFLLCGLFIWKRRSSRKNKEDKSTLLGNQVRVSLVELGKDNASMLWGNINEASSLVSVIPEGIPLEKIQRQSQLSSSSDSIHYLAQKVEALVHRLENHDTLQSMPKSSAGDQKMLPYGYNVPSNRSSSIIPSSYHSSLPRTISCSSVLSSPKSSSLPSSNGIKSFLQTPSSESPFHSQYQLADDQVVILRPKPGRKGKFSSRAPSEHSWPEEFVFSANNPLCNAREPSERTCPQSGMSQWSRDREPSESSYRVEDNEWSDIPEENAENVLANEESHCDLTKRQSSSFRQRLSRRNSSQRRNSRSRSLSSTADSESIRSFIRHCIQTVAAEENARLQSVASASNSTPTQSSNFADAAESFLNSENCFDEGSVEPTTSSTVEKEKTN